MQRFGTAHGAGCARSMLAHTTLLFCIGWILNFAGDAVAAPVIERGGGGKDGNNRIDNQPIVSHISNDNRDDLHSTSERVTDLTENNLDNKRDNIETDYDDGTPPVMLLPENVLSAVHRDEDSNLSRNVNASDDKHEEHGSLEESQKNNVKVGVIEYQPNLVIRCAAKSNPKPNVTWEYEGGSFPHYVIANSLTNGHGYVHSKGVDDGLEMDNSGEYVEDESWVDLKLPKLNNAFYGTLCCRAENKYGNTTWELELIHNANSSMLMKAVRCTAAIVFLLGAIIAVKLVLWIDRKRRDKLYERLPPQDLEIIKKFKKGLEPPPPSPCSSMIVQDTSKSLLDGATSCIKGIEITVSGDEGDASNINDGALKEGYRPVKHGSSSPDFQKRLINGSSPTPSTCSSNQFLNTVNSWTNYAPYDDKMETSSQHFDVDFTKIIENGSYGLVYFGKMRNDLTMEWSNVAVKCGKMERNDDSHLLESILTELKILASLPKPHDNIVNLRGAYTKLLHKRQALVFVDYCELGNLATFIDLNRKNFRDIFMDSVDAAKSADAVTKDIAGSSQIVTGNENRPITFTATPEIQMSPENDKTVQLEHTISHKELFAWAWQTAEGMNFLHKNRVVHGNLSTANIYITSKLKVKIGNIGYSPGEEAMQISEEASKKWLSVPHYSYEPFSKRSDVWDYGRVIWDIFSLREQECPDTRRIVEFIQTNDAGEDASADLEFDIPQYATSEIFELMLCCWNENATLCPEFDFFVKSFKKHYKEVVASICVKDKSQEN